MRDLIAAALSSLVLVSPPSRAEFRVIPAPDLNAGGVLYLDSSYVALKGSTTRRAWVLFDKKAGRSTGAVRSSMSLIELDCGENAVRVLEFVTFREPMGQGHALLRSSVPSDWEKVVSNSGMASAFDLVCHDAARKVLSQYR
jgi:hypothetical protein